MKKVNFKKLTNSFLAGVFGLALMGGVMLNTQEAEAQTSDLITAINDLAQTLQNGDQIPCTSSFSPLSQDEEPSSVVRCDTCMMTPGKSNNQSLQGSCKRDTSKKNARKLNEN